MFFEPGMYGDMLPFGKTGIVETLGFATPPGAEKGSDAHVLNEHTYCCQLATDMCPHGEPLASRMSECLPWHEKRIGTRSKDAEGLGIPLIISEFGACLDSEVCADEITFVAETTDKYLAGWAYWEFKPFHDLTTSAGTGSEGFYNKDGTLQHKKMRALTRPYLRNAQG